MTKIKFKRIENIQWDIEIGYNDFERIYDYWFIFQDGEQVLGANTPNETMARRWLSMKHLQLSKDKIEEIISKAKKEAGWD